MKNIIEGVIIGGDKAGDGKSISVVNSEHVDLVISALVNQGGTVLIKIKGSFTDADFSKPASLDNPWDFVQVVNLNDGVAADGDTGIVFEESGVSQFSLNANGLKFISAEIVSIKKAIASVKFIAYNV